MDEARGQTSTIHVGQHVVEIHPPDQFLFRIVGDVSPAEVVEVFDLMQAFASGVSRFYWLMDISGMGEVRGEARLAGASAVLPSNFAALVMFGGNFQQRTVAQLAALAGERLRRRKGPTKTHFVEDEAEAFAWANAHRDRKR